MIKLSKKWSYALKAIIYIACSYPEKINIKDISSSEKISENLLRRIIADLEKWWLVKTIKWRNGWVTLKMPADKITIYNILASVWEELWITECTRWDDCENISSCSTTSILSDLQKWFNSLLKMYTLDKIIKKSED